MGKQREQHRNRTRHLLWASFCESGHDIVSHLRWYRRKVFTWIQGGGFFGEWHSSWWSCCWFGCLLNLLRCCSVKRGRRRRTGIANIAARNMIDVDEASLEMKTAKRGFGKCSVKAVRDKGGPTDPASQKRKKENRIKLWLSKDFCYVLRGAHANAE